MASPDARNQYHDGPPNLARSDGQIGTSFKRPTQQTQPLGHHSHGRSYPQSSTQRSPSRVMLDLPAMPSASVPVHPWALWYAATRGIKTTTGLRVLAAGHAFVQNLRRGHYEIAADEPADRRLAIAFTERAVAI